MTNIIAHAIYDHERLIEERSLKIESQIASSYPFSRPWYFDKALEFQLGDTLVFDKGSYKFNYPTIDESMQIIKHVAVRQLVIDNLTVLRIYATKEGKKALSESELLAFKSYISQIGAAGTHFVFVSKAPDELELNYNVFYNPQVLSFTGERLSGGGKPVEEAVTFYLNNILYGGAFNRTRNIDAIQSADGVVDVVLNDVLLNGELTNTQSFESESGFFNAKTINVTYTPSYES